MGFHLVKSSDSNCKTFWMILILIICLFLIINNIYHHKNSEYFDNKKLVNKIIPTVKPDPTYNIGVCSKNCCATQWTTPINLTENSKVNPADIGKKYFTSNLTCNNGILNTGCVCLTPESKKLFNNNGYVKQLPMSNGLLDADNRKSVWQLNDNLINKPAVLGQTTQLTGEKDENNLIGGLAHDKTYRLGLIDSDIDIIKNYSIPINNNMIQWDNDKINDNLVANIVSTNIQTPTDKLLKNPLGASTLKINIK
jgi:hypothetical protein